LSDIRANTISDTSGNGPINLTGQSAAKAWINFSGLNATIGSDMTGVRGSFNVSSLVSIATGIDETNYTNNFANGNYSATAGTTSGGTAHFSSGVYTASTLRTTTKDCSCNNENAGYISFMAAGDLA
jgi:hypothetical protein